MLKYATAIRTGTASTEAILGRFMKANAAHPTYQAMIELGRAQRSIFLLVTWNLTVEQRSSLHGGNDHELRRWVGHRQGSAGEMAGPGTARTSGRMVAGVDRSRASAPDDRRVCPRSGRIPAHVRPIRRRSDHREPGTHCRLRT